MNYLSIFALLAQIIPGLVAGVEALAGPGNGDVKKQAVTQMANVALGTVTALSTGGQATSLTHLAPAISSVIDASVELANSAGVFGKNAQ